MSNKKYKTTENIKILGFSASQILLGLLLIVASPEISHIETISFSLVSVGSLLFVLVYNNQNNPLATTGFILNMSYALTIYSGASIWVVHKELITAQTMLFSVGTIVLIGILIALIPKKLNIESSDLNTKVFSFE